MLFFIFLPCLYIFYRFFIARILSVLPENFRDWGAAALPAPRVVRLCIQMKATEQYFPVVLFIMLYKVVLTFESVDEILKCDHSNESY